MCVSRYAAKVMRNERSEMKHNRSEMPAKSHNKHASQRDAISPPKGNLMLSHSAGMHNTDIFYCRHFEKIPFRFAPLHLFCIPAYTHQIPNGISSHLFRDNMYIISLFYLPPVLASYFQNCLPKLRKTPSFGKVFKKIICQNQEKYRVLARYFQNYLPKPKKKGIFVYI